MESFRKFGRLINFPKNRSVCLFYNMLNYSSYHSYSVTTNVKSDMILFKNVKLNWQKYTQMTNVLLIRNISLSNMFYAKSKDKGGNKKKKNQKAATLDLRELAEMCDVDDLISKMTQSVENMKINFMKNLVLRSTTGALEQIPVKVEGKEYELQELAQIARKPKVVVLNLAAFPTAIPVVIKAIETSGLNINPQQDGTTVFLPIPKVTKEHRENLSKNAKAIFIKHRDEIKDIRSKTIKNLKKRSDLTEDAIHRAAEQVEALCDKYLKEAELLLETKQNELLRSTE